MDLGRILTEINCLRGSDPRYSDLLVILWNKGRMGGLIWLTTTLIVESTGSFIHEWYNKQLFI